MRKLFGMIAPLAVCAVALSAAEPAGDGLLVVAHGARSGAWNDRVLQMLEKVEWAGPKDVGFLAARKPEEELAAAAARLDTAGVKRIGRTAHGVFLQRPLRGDPVLRRRSQNRA